MSDHPVAPAHNLDSIGKDIRLPDHAVDMDGRVIGAAHGGTVPECDMNGSLDLFIFKQITGNLQGRIDADSEFRHGESSLSCFGERLFQLFAAFAFKMDGCTVADADSGISANTSSLLV